MKDREGCAILVIGTFKGGELVLYEAGIVFELLNGDLFVFPSKDISHFNLHYEGVRLSLVMHSDKDGIGYQKDGSGWASFIDPPQPLYNP